MAERARFTLRIPAALLEPIRQAASEQDRAVNQQVNRYVRQGLVRDGLLPGWPEPSKG